MQCRSGRWPWIIVASTLALAFLTACGGGQDDAPDASPYNASRRDVIALGESLFAANCQSCHGDRSGAGGVAAAPPHDETGHTWHHPDAQLIDWVLNGKFPGQMPAFGDRLSREQVEAILAYIKTWWTEEQRATQADVSERYQEALDREAAD